MADDTNKIYAVVIFPPRKGEEKEIVAVVPQSWVQDEICVWPVTCKSVSKVIENCVPPTEASYKWKPYKITKVRENIEGLKRAKIIDLNTRNGKSGASEASPSPDKRFRAAPDRFSPSPAGKVNTKRNRAPSKVAEVKKNLFVSNEEGRREVLSQVNENVSPKRPRRKLMLVDSPDDADDEGASPQSKRTPVSSISAVSTPEAYPTPPLNFTPREYVSCVLGDSAQSENPNPNKSTKRSENPKPNKSTERSENPKPNKSTERSENPKPNKSTESTSTAQNSTTNSATAPDHNSSSNLDASVAHNSSSNLDASVADNSTSNAVPGLTEREKFRNNWKSLSPEDKDYYTAESLYLLRKHLLSTKTSTSAKIDPDLEIFPIDSDDILKEAHRRMVEVKGFKKKLERELSKKVSNEVNKTAKSMCRFLFTDQWAKQYSMFGFKKKKIFNQLKIVQLLFTVIDNHYNGKDKNTAEIKVPEQTISDAIKKWVTHCSSRISKKAKRNSVNRGMERIAISDSDE